jgi:extracellular elastinolytic metalloproteinase
MATRSCFAARMSAALFLLALHVAPTQAAVRLEDLHRPIGTQDFRAGELPPLPSATALVASRDWSARWNRYGTVHTLRSPSGFLATGLNGDPEAAARTWLKAHRELFRLSAASVDALELIRETPLNQSGAVVLLFRQVANGMPVAYDGRIKMGLVNGQLFWVASSSIGDIGALPATQLTPMQAWLTAASAVALKTPLPAPIVLGTQDEWPASMARSACDAA